MKYISTTLYALISQTANFRVIAIFQEMEGMNGQNDYISLNKLEGQLENYRDNYYLSTNHYIIIIFFHKHAAKLLKNPLEIEATDIDMKVVPQHSFIASISLNQ